MKRWTGILGLLTLAVFAAAQSGAQAGPPPVQPPPPAQSGQQQGPPTMQGMRPTQPGQNDQDAQTQKDPNQGVARVSLLRGDGSTQRADSGDWMAATINTPLVTGDKVSTGDHAQMELQLDFANVLRLSGNTEAALADLTHNHIQIQLAQGLIEYSVTKENEADIEIDTPNVGIAPTKEGSYRIQVNSADETVVIVRDGEVQITTPGGSTKLVKGEMATIHGAGADAQYKKEDAPARDEWDKWNEQRDHVMQSAQSWKHTNPYYTGSSDLDNNGEWSEVPDYGQVWTPNNVSPDWAPYTDGSWVWEPYYGWTWVSAEPWGWAPYHYGRWFNYGGAWRWWPGPVYAGYRPVWAPAYVSFFGFGHGGFGLGFGFGFGFGSIGWLPIGPCDPFFPWWGWGGFGFRFGFFGFHDFDRFRFGFADRGFRSAFPGARAPLAGHFDERFSNFRQAANGGRALSGVSSVRAEQFGHGAMQNTRGISASDFNSAHGIGGSVPAVPTHQSLSATNRAANPSTIHASTHFFGSNARTQSAVSQHTSFNEQAGRIQQALHGGNAGNSNSERGGSTNMDRGTQGNNNSRGFQSFNGSNTKGTATTQPNRGVGGNTQSDRPPASRTFEGQGTQRTQTPQQGQNNNGFQRFSQPAQPTQPRFQGGQQNGQQPTRPTYGGNSTYNSRPPLNMSRPIVNGNSRMPSSPNNSYRPPANSGTRPPSPPPSRPSGNSSSHGSSGGSKGGGSKGGGHHK